jgi:predicted DNA-binding transcriptional regulator AlpA
MEATHLCLKDAAAYLGISYTTLYGWRQRGRGPASQKFGGRVLYAIADLEAWRRAHGSEGEHQAAVIEVEGAGKQTIKQAHLCTKEAAVYLGLSHFTLNDWRIKGWGPPFYKFGRSVLYAIEDLKAWKDSRRHAATHVPASGLPKGR